MPLPSDALDQQDTEHRESIKHVNNPIDSPGTTGTLESKQMAGAH